MFQSQPHPKFFNLISFFLELATIDPDVARQVREFWALRQLIESSNDTLTGANLPGASPKLIIGDLMQRLDQTRAMIDPRVSGFRTTKEVVDGVAERVAARYSGELKKTTVTTGLADLDRRLGGGFVPGDLIVVETESGSYLEKA